MSNLIHLNGKEVLTTHEDLSYADIVCLAHPHLTNTPPGCTVVFSKGHMEKPSGILIPRQRVKVKEGMIITAVWTGAA